MALPVELQELAQRVSNWGRWGDRDERGTLNLIDADATRRGLALVTDGRHRSLALPLDATAPQAGGAPGRIAPLRTMLAVNQTYTGQEGDAAPGGIGIDQVLRAPLVLVPPASPVGDLPGQLLQLLGQRHQVRRR